MSNSDHMPRMFPASGLDDMRLIVRQGATLFIHLGNTRTEAEIREHLLWFCKQTIQALEVKP